MIVNHWIKKFFWHVGLTWVFWQGYEALAQTLHYPTRPIRIVVPFSAGGSTDILARLLAQKLNQTWGVPVVVDNRAGANGLIASDLVAKANPDGYTLLMVAIGHAVNPSLLKHLPYNTATDFQALSLTAILPLLLAVHPQLNVRTTQELITLARSNTKALNYASGGIGSSQHLAAELINTMANVHMVHVPYKGGGPGLMDLLAGQVDLMASTILSISPHGRNGQLRVLGITSAKRNPLWPETPTLAESGLPGYNSIAWYGLVAPSGLQPFVLTALSREIIKATHTPSVKDTLIQQGAEPVGNNPADFTLFLRNQTDQYARLIRQAGIKAE